MSADLLSEARRRLDAGDPRSAHQLAERAYEASRTSGSPETRWRAAHLVGEALYVLGDISGARVRAGEALRLSQASGDPAALGADLNLLGVIEIGEGRLEEAVFLLRRSYDLREQAGGPDSSDAIESLNNLAGALWRAGNEDEALRLHEDALRRCERALGEDHRRTAETLNALAVKLDRRPEWKARARELQERGLASAEAAQGPDSALVAQLVANVAAQRLTDGDVAGMGPLVERALELHERHFGPGSRWTTHAVMLQGEHAFAEGRHAAARVAFERALVIWVRELGPESEEALAALTGLSKTLAELMGEPRPLDELDPARPFAQEAMSELAALELVLVALHPDLAGTLPGGGGPDRAQAASQLRRIADRIEARTSTDDRQQATIVRAAELTEAADTAYLAGDVGAAKDALREAISLLESVRGPADTSLVEPLQRLKRVHWSERRESEILPIARRVASILSGAYGDLHPLALQALGEVYRLERRDYGPAGGRETAARLERLMRDALGEPSQVFQLVKGVLDAAREVAGDEAEPADPPLSVRRERFLDEPGRLAGELLADLGETPWEKLEHAYGPAVDTPLNLRLLLAEDEWVRSDALEQLGESLFHQGSKYPASPPALVFLRRLAADDRVPGRDAVAAFVAEVE